LERIRIVNDLNPDMLSPLRTLLVERLSSAIASGTYPDAALIAVPKVVDVVIEGMASDEAAEWDAENVQDQYDGGRLS
jgi:hypothetical protein